MKKTLTLRTQLIILMALLVFLQSIALVLALSVSRVFFMLDAESFRLFNNTTNTRMQTFNEEISSLVSNVANEATDINQMLVAYAKEKNASLQDLYLEDTFYAESTSKVVESTVRLLQENSISGAFFILDGSNSNKEDKDAHSTVYIRNSTPGKATTDNYLLEIGPIAVSQEYKISTGINWGLDLTFDSLEEAKYDFYTKPMQAAADYPKSEMLRYGYWAKPGAILRDNQQVVVYTLPLLDEAGNAYGVMGVEISLTHFTQHYLPNVDLPYPNSFYAIASVKGEDLSLDWCIPSGPIAQVYLEQGTHLPLKDVQGVDLYEAKLDGLGDMYCSAQTLTMYSQNSPFIDDVWSLVGFAPQEAMHEGSTGVRSTLIISIIGTTVLAFAAIFLLTFISTRKISGLSEYIKGLSPNQDVQFEKTGMREIDELTAAVQTLNQSVKTASQTTSRILELTLLPIGGYEVSTEVEYVVLTEYIHKLLGIEMGTTISKKEWEQHSKALTAQPSEEHEDIYLFTNQETNQGVWLRILEAQTQTGTIGVVLDVTKDIEENRRLAHELDYDALTHLYNRNAFKREVHAKIQAEPNKIGVMIFADLDNLKYINDTFGHDMGDRLIIQAGEMFREFTSHDGVVSRISGDEFAIYLHGFDSKDEARQLISMQYKKNEAYSLATSDGGQHKIRSSSGIAWYPDDSNNVTDLLKLSDYAMYEAKSQQKGSLFEFNKDSYTKNAYLLENREAINRLLDEKLIRFAYQPIVDLKTGDVFAYEALMRPLLENFKSPLEIIAVATAQSKLGQLERLVMLMAFQMVDENKASIGDRKIFVNSVPSQMMSKEDHLFIERRYKHVFGTMVVEITEAENDSPKTMTDKVSFIKGLGIQLALDGFGTGYSNEMRILTIQPDIIKIDMEMVQGIHTDVDKQKLVVNLVSFCRPKNIKIIAEGVEEKEDLEMVASLGVDYVQGYYTGRPDFEMKDIDSAIKAQILAINESL